MSWNNQVAVVTGGARGIGRAIALLLAQRGAAVCINYAARADAAEKVASDIAAAGGRAITAKADVGDFAAVQAMVARAEAQLGPVTILVNNAGLFLQATLENFDDAQLEQMRRVNADGVIHGTRAVMAGMRARRYGRIINVASIAAFGTALPGSTFYAATKAEVVILTRRFAMELGRAGITVNAIAPGFVRTDMTQGGRSEAEWQTLEKPIAERTIMGRVGQPTDIAQAAAFLAAPETSWLTAQTLTVDGGRMDYLAHG